MTEPHHPAVAAFVEDASELAVIVEQSQLTVALSEAEVALLHSLLDKAVLAMDAPTEYLRTLLGPDPGPIGGPLLAQMNAGAGHFRHCRDTLRRLYRAKNTLAIAREAAK